MSTIKLLII